MNETLEKNISLKEIISEDQFLAYFFPKEYEKKRIEKMSPEEYGRYLAKKSFEEIKEILK